MASSAHGRSSKQILPGFKVGLDGYYKQADYQLDEGQFGAPVFLTPFNYRRAYTLGVELTTTWVLRDFSAYGNLAAGQQQATGIASAQALFSAEDFAYIQSHYIVTDHSQLVTASAGVTYLWRSTRASIDMIAGSGLRRSVQHPNDSTNPPYQQLNFRPDPRLRRAGDRQARGALRRDQRARQQLRVVRRHRRRRLRQAVRAAPRILRRAQEGLSAVAIAAYLTLRFRGA